MATNPEIAVGYADKIKQALEAIKIDFPAVNSILDQSAQRYYQWKEAEKYVADELKDARETLIAEIHVPDKKGNHLVHDSRYTAVNAQVVSSPRTLDQKALQSALVKQFNLSLEDAEAFIDACRKEPGLQTRLTVQVKR